MRIEPTEIHPVVWKAIDDYERTAAIVSRGNADMSAVVAKHQAEWWRTYGRGFLMGTAFWLIMMILAAQFGKAAGAPWLLSLTILGMTGHGIYAYLRNRRHATPGELLALLPGLDLDPSSKLYLEALAEAYSQNLPEDLRRATVEELRSLMEESVKLQNWQKDLQTTISQVNMEGIEGEVARLQERHDRASDAVARETYRQGIELAQQRLDLADRYRPYLERIEAQQELVRQALLRVKADLGRTRVAPSAFAATELSGLRQSTLQIRSHADEIERAVLELQAGTTQSTL